MDNNAKAKFTKNNVGLMVMSADAVPLFMKPLQAWRDPHPIKNQNLEGKNHER